MMCLVGERAVADSEERFYGRGASPTLNCALCWKKRRAVCHWHLRLRMPAYARSSRQGRTHEAALAQVFEVLLLPMQIHFTRNTANAGHQPSAHIRHPLSSLPDERAWFSAVCVANADAQRQITGSGTINLCRKWLVVSNMVVTSPGKSPPMRRRQQPHCAWVHERGG